MGYMTLGYENGLTILLALIAFIIVLFSQIKVNSAYKINSKIKTKQGISGFEVARQILDANGLEDVHIVETKGSLSDHYDPTRKVVKLSKEVFHGNSIASVAVAAHEVGHAIQDKEKYVFMKIRSTLVPIINFISYLGYIVIFISFILGAFAYFTYGIIIMLGTILFQLVTLPVEFDASKRADIELTKLNIIDNSEKYHVKSMLNAAAFTYVASLISSLLNLLRLIIMAQDRD